MISPVLPVSLGFDIGVWIETRREGESKGKCGSGKGREGKGMGKLLQRSDV